MDAAEVALVRRSLEGVLRDTPPDEFPAILAKLGWQELCDDDPAVAIGELFEAQGRLVAGNPALDLVVVGALGADLPDDGAVVHPALPAWDAPPGRIDDDGTVAVDGLVLAGATRAATLLIPAEAPDGRLRLIVGAGAGLERHAQFGFDESLSLVRITGRIAAGGRERVPGPGPDQTTAARQPDPLAVPWWEVAAAARRALGHELAGLTQAMLDSAARYVTDRHQYGRPVAAFQAVRHRLADVHVALSAARSVLGTAWRVTDPLAADAAKVLAGRAAQLGSQHCLQVTGAIGFTWEHDLHRRIRRAHLLDGLYGSADALEGRIGATLIARRAVPRLGVMAP